VIGRRDDDVVRRAKLGDADAWRTLYRANATRLKIWLDAVPTGDAATGSEDIAASAWLTASRRIESFHGSSSDFAGWLFTIARNVARTTMATGARRATYPADVTTSDQAQWGVVDDVGTHVDAAAGFDIATTARILGISEVAVRVGHHRGIGRLRNLVGDAETVADADSPPLSVRTRPSPGVSS
jgi:RNA polymerase sigma-70 factor, ECF subfamily